MKNEALRYHTTESEESLPGRAGIDLRLGGEKISRPIDMKHSFKSAAYHRFQPYPAVFGRH
jgi:hypothetical protein